jgi:kynurenine formamidase
VFLSNDVILVECLTGLEQIPGTEFLFCATPLNIAGHDGSPVRAIAILED